MNLHRMFPIVVVGEDSRGLTHPFYTPYRRQMFELGNQEPLKAPSVFNFYSPFHSPKGDLSDNDLVAPEFQIFTMQTAHDLSNTIWSRLALDPVVRDVGPWDTWFALYRYDDENGEEVYWHPVLHHDISDYEDLAETPADLVDRLDLVMTHGNLSNHARSRLIRRIEQVRDDSRERVWFAIWYMATLPDYIVETP